MWVLGVSWSKGGLVATSHLIRAIIAPKTSDGFAVAPLDMAFVHIRGRARGATRTHPGERYWILLPLIGTTDPDDRYLGPTN